MGALRLSLSAADVASASACVAKLPSAGSLVGTAVYSNPFSWLSPIRLRRRVLMAGSISAQAACEDDPRYPSNIGSDPLDRKAPRPNDFHHRIGLPQADLRGEEPARHEQPR